MIVDGIEDVAQLPSPLSGPDLDAGVAGIGLPLADADVLDVVAAAARQDFVETLGNSSESMMCPCSSTSSTNPCLPVVVWAMTELHVRGFICGTTGRAAILSGWGRRSLLL